MREILFRGKRADNGKWVEGLPIKTYDTEIGKNSVDYVNPVPVVLMASSRIILEGGGDEIPFFNTGECPIVNPETISQYTGMTQEQTAEKMNISMSYLKKQGKLALKVFELENNVQNTQKNLKKFVCAKTVKKKRNVL